MSSVGAAGEVGVADKLAKQSAKTALHDERAVVAMTEDRATGGYWEVVADGVLHG